MKILYFYTDQLDQHSVFESQVVGWYRALRLSKVDAYFLLAYIDPGTPGRRDFIRRRIRGLKAEFGQGRVSGFRFPMFPCQRLNSLLVPAYLLWLVARRFGIGPSEKVVIHAHGHAFFIALHLGCVLPNTRIVADIRADHLAESLDFGGIPAEKLNLLRMRYGRAYQKADGWICVSRALVDRTATLADLRKPSLVVPCCHDPALFFYSEASREAKRSELGVNERYVVVYIGLWRQWADPQRIIDCFRHIKKEKPEAFLFVLTGDTAAALRDLHDFMSTGDACVRTVPHEQVGGYLCAADLGLLLRDSSPTNQVASPTKFAEYLACGLPVLRTTGIGDLDEVCARLPKDLFPCLPPTDHWKPDLWISALPRGPSPEQRASLASEAHRIFDRKKYAEAAGSFYNDLFLG